MKTFVKIGLLLVALTALLYWQDVWAWVDGKSSMELAGEILGFSLKWFYLALLAFLMATIPHYLMPWLKLARLNGRRQLRAVRRNRGVAQVEARTTMPSRMNKNEVLLWMAGQMAKGNRPTRQPADSADEINLKF